MYQSAMADLKEVAMSKAMRRLPSHPLKSIDPYFLK